MFEMIGNTARDAVVGGTFPGLAGGKLQKGRTPPTFFIETRCGCFDHCLTSMYSLIKQIPKRPRLRPVCEFTTGWLLFTL
jgi:hypothetical protein